MKNLRAFLHGSSYRYMLGSATSMDGEHGGWTDIPEELLTLILSNLFLDDVNRFRAVCRTWKSVPDPPCWDPIELSPVKFPVVQSQWLMEKDLANKTCNLFHPIYCGTYRVDVPNDEDSDIAPVDAMPPDQLSSDAAVNSDVLPSTLRFSKEGWLLMSEGDYSISFLNPFTREKMYLPDLPYPEIYSFRGITHLSTPASRDCLVFGISAHFNTYVAILIIRRGQEDWNVLNFQNNLPIIPSSCTPVFHKGMIYCLGELGNLGVFDPKNDQWTVLSDPRKPCKRARENYLIDNDGELVAVFVGRMGLWISVFRLDESKMAWEEVTSLGDRMLFISVPTSFSRKKVIDGMENKIYFPRLHKGYPVFYSLDTRKYHTLGSGFSNTSLYETEEMLNSGWIEPRADHYTEKQLDWFA